MPTKVIKVPSAIAERGRKKAGGVFQDERYGKDYRVCTTYGPDGDRFRDTVTGEEFSKGDAGTKKGKKK